MSDIYYYEQRDGTVKTTTGLDTFLSVNSLTKRVFKPEADRLKCIHDNDRHPWGYYLDKEESMLIILKSSEPTESESILDFDDYYP